MNYGEPTKLPDGRYFVRITGNDGRIFEQMNRAEVTTDNCFRVLQGHDKLKKYDDIIIQQAVASSESWFSKKLDESFLQGVYESSVSPDNILEAPLAKIKGNVVAIAFDSDKEPVDISTVTPASTWDILIELVGIWFLKKTFGPVWRVIQLRHCKVNTGKQLVPPKYMFSDEGESGHQEEDEDI